MRSFIFIVLSALLCFSANAQTQPLGTVLGNQTVIPISIYPPGYAVNAQALIYYPDDYFLPQNANKKYPMFLFLHGAGEGTSSNIAEVLNTSLPQLIAQGLKPWGIDTVTGDTVKFIVVSPHCANCGGSYSYPQLQYTIPYLIANYRIDTTCIWAGGLSSGGRGTFSLPMGNVVGDTLLGRRLAGIMPMANGGYDNRTDLFPNLITAMQGGLAVLYTIGDQDPGYNAMGYFQYDALMSKYAQPGKYYTKVIVGGTHSAGVWNPPFYLTSRLWNARYNAWTQMASTRRGRNNNGGTPVPTLGANAGTAQTITLPTNSVSLAGQGLPGGGAVIAGYAWSQVNGPNTATFSTPAAASTNVTGLIAGAYTFRLTVTSTQGLKATSDVNVTVNAAQSVTVSAGSPQTITLPTNSVSLAGQTTVLGGAVIASFAWSQVSGPNTAGFSTASSVSTNATGLIAGAYVFRLTVTTLLGLQVTADVTVTVNAAPAITVNAGNAQTITLPASSVNLSGQASTSGGAQVTSYAWSEVSGPNTAGITTPAAATTAVTGLSNGVYVFRLTVSGNPGIKSTGDVQVTVNTATAPSITLNPGNAQTITLPVSSVNLAATVTTAGGVSITSFVWSLVSGPNVPTINTNVNLLTASVTGLIAGTYVFRFTANNNAKLNASGDVQVTVNPIVVINPGNPPVDTVNHQFVIPVPVNAPGYAMAKALVYYPDDYFQPANASKRYALYIFLHTEAQGMSGDINDVTKASLPMLIAQGLRPYGIDSVTGDTVKFIVVSPHAAYSYGSYSWPQLRYTIPYLMNTLRVDTSCVWLGGPSMGGRGTFSVPMEDTVLGKRLAGIMPMSAGGYDTRWDLIPNLQTCLKRGMGYIYTVGATDVGVLDNARTYNNYMKAAVQPGRGFYTEIPGLGHVPDAWTIPFYLTTRWWNNNKNAWDIMANNRRLAGIKTAAAATGLKTFAAVGMTSILDDSTAVQTGKLPAFSLYPNPVKDQFTMVLNNAHLGTMLVQVVDGSGAVRRTMQVNKSLPVTQVQVQVGDLTAGIYFVRIQIGNWSEIHKIMKL